MKDYELECSNMFYMPNFNIIGGTETFMYELTRKYKKYDIVVVYRNADTKQLARISKNVRMHKYCGGRIKCKNAFFNYGNDIIDKVDAEEYTQIIHAMYKTNKLTPKIYDKMTRYFAVSNGAAKEWEELTGIKPIVVINPLELVEEEKKPVLYLISATRLTEEKGKWRMEKLAKALDQANINYLWLIFTNDTNVIDNPNVVYIEPRLNIRPFIASIKGKGYGVQLSDCEGDCYFTRECEAFGVPLIVTPIPSFEEQGLKEGINCYYMPFNMEEINIERIKNIPDYSGYMIKDNWIEYLVKAESTYKEENMKAKLRCIRSYTDIQLGKELPLGYEWVVDRKRAEELLNNPNNLVELVEWVEEQPKKEKAVKPTKKAIKR